VFNGIKQGHWQSDGIRNWRPMKRSFVGQSGHMMFWHLCGQSWVRAERLVAITPMRCRRHLHFVAWLKRGETFSRQQEGHGLRKGSHCLSMLDSSVNNARGMPCLLLLGLNIYITFYHLVCCLRSSINLCESSFNFFCWD